MRARLLSAVLLVDALISVGFGLVSAMRPAEVYGTIIDLTGATPVMVPLLRSVSLNELLFGLLSGGALFAPTTVRVFVAGAMAVRHGLFGFTKLTELGASWLVGHPWPDLVIHAALCTVFTASVVQALRAGTPRASPTRMWPRLTDPPHP